MSAAPPYPSALPPVTVLSGFLGAGKTTLLNHLLAQADGRRWAAVVNDVAAINIDAAVVRRASTGTAEVVELGNGCVCCSSRDELGETLARLAVEGNYEHILVETTGVAEPRAVAALFLQRNPFGKSLLQLLRLSSLVTVVDSRHFLDAWKHSEPARVDPQPTSAPKPVFDLMVEQVECADFILLNKADLLSAGEKTEILALVSGLNPRAECVFTEQSQVSAEALLDRPRFSATQTLRSAKWIQILNTKTEKERAGSGLVLAPKASRHEERFGIRSFVFEARRPFAAGKLESFLNDPLPGLLRAKGFFWLESRPDEMGFLSVAGKHAQFDFLNYWWAALIEHGKASRSDVPPALESVWQEPHGDRRQELVFIGVGLDEAKWRSTLENCLAAG